jgi:hypothetical protein
MISVTQALAERERHIDRLERQADERTGEAALTAAQRAELVQIRRRAEPVFNALSHAVPMAAEKPLPYRVKLASMLQRHAKEGQWRNTDLASLARVSPSAFGNAEAAIYTEAQRNGLDWSYRGDAKRGQLRERIEVDQAGRETKVFHGDIRSWLDAFTTPVQVAVEKWKK